MTEQRSEDVQTVASYMDLRTRGEGDVARTVEIVPGALMLDIDDEGRALGIEKISDRPIALADLFMVIFAAQFGRQLHGGAS